MSLASNEAGHNGVAAPSSYVEPGDAGYRKTMSNFQIQMIAIGGAIGTGLFLGLGSRLAAAGPALILAYLVTGAVVYLLGRAIGELVMHRPTTGSFVSWAREFYGDRLAHMTGWIITILGSLIGLVEIAAVSVYIQYWWPEVPGWIPSLVAWMLIVGSNLFSARSFGFIEVAASSVKVAAILLFIAAGLIIVFLGGPLGFSHGASVTHLWDGGFFTNGVLIVALVSTGAVFSYSGVEISAVSAGEARNAREIMPKAIKSIVFRIAVFYIGSVIVLSMLLPTSAYSGKESPFVTALASFDIPWLGAAMNFVVLTAALSGVNATLYATVRAFRTLAANGDAPRFANRMSRQGVPVGALLGIGGFYFLSVIMTAFFGGVHVFELALGASAVCMIILWITIFACQLRLRKLQDAGLLPVVGFRMPGAPVTTWIGILALVGVFLSMVVPGTSETWWISLIGTALLLGVITLGYEVTSRRRFRRAAAGESVQAPASAEPVA
ncbi:amino acid permease [Sinomonas halotolerans]|uniref:Amino acid permease n=1 Tax=Sinomonas halotolerans TaxID=1644133 RepID=A0ABU9WYP0_9MICC